MESRETTTRLSFNLKKLLKEKGIKQVQLARDLGFNAATVSTWMTGRRMPRTSKLEQIADYFGVTISQLLSEEITDNGETLEENPDKHIKAWDYVPDDQQAEFKVQKYNLMVEWMGDTCRITLQDIGKEQG